MHTADDHSTSHRIKKYQFPIRAKQPYAVGLHIINIEMYIKFKTSSGL